jgi:amidase
MPLPAQPIDPLGAFMDYPDVPIAHAATGTLAGLSMAVKDLFDVEGYPTGCGHPDILAHAAPATRHAEAVEKLLTAGVRFAGKTLTDEIAFSLNGINHHYGAPVNPKAPDRISGGSSSGSVSATAGGIVDFALGTDTGGSIRAPASYCGIFGLRTTHGRLSLAGCMDLAPSFDTLGWFALDMATYRKVGDILFDPAGAVAIDRPRPAVVADVLPIMDPGPRAVFLETIVRLRKVLGDIGSVEIAGGRLDDWYQVGRTCQLRDIWAQHGGWITRDNPVFGPGVRERIEWAKGLSADDTEIADRHRADIRARVIEMTDRHGILILPTLPGIAPLKSSPIGEIEKFRDRALKNLCLAGISGVPQISMPIAQFDGAPFGISLMGSAGTDEALMDFAAQIEAALGTF